MRDVNQAFMMRVNWRFCAQDLPVQALFIRSKYRCGSNPLSVINKLRQCSNFWWGLYSFWDTYCQNIIQRVGDGKSIKFWNDQWLPGCGRLANLSVSITLKFELQKSVVDYISRDERRQIDLNKDYLPLTMLQMVTNMTIRLDMNQDEIIAWRKSSDGVFNMKFVYEENGAMHTPNSDLFQRISKWKVRERLKGFFMEAQP